MVNWGIIIGLISVLVFVIVILSIALPPLFQYANNETQRKLLDKIDDSHKLMCGMPDKFSMIFDMVDIIPSDNFDNKAKGIYQQMQWGKDIQSCDIIYFYNQLDAEQKEKLNWLELSCDVHQCLDN